MLRVVAACDYGDNATEYFAALKQIRAGLEPDEPIGWIPNEVLCVFRWSDFSSEKALISESDFHTARAFCCAVLLRNPDIVENRSLFDNDSVAPLLESCQHLGEPDLRHLTSYLAWSLGTMEPWDEDYLFHATALVLAAASGSLVLRSRVATLGEWLIRIDAEIRPWHFDENSYPSERAAAWLRYELTPEPKRWRSFLDIPYATISQKLWRRVIAKTATGLPEGELRTFLERA